jgi:predicted O-linked N-acetylglucosamine transferase (SPINDLY family)
MASANDSADALIAEGNRAEDSGRLREACDLYREAVAASPGHARAHLNLGIALEALGDVEGAIRSYQSALGCDSGNPYASYNLGKLQYARGEPEVAERHLRFALERKPDFPEAHVVLSNVLDAQGDLTGAAAELEAALKERPDYPGALYNYATVLRKLRRLAEAESALRRVLSLDPGYSHARYQLGALLQARGELDEAERLLRLALDEGPESAEIHMALYDVHKSRGSVDLALAELERALQLRPGWAQAWFYRGVLLNRIQRVPEAETALRRAIELDPGLSGAYRILAGVLVSQLRVDEGLEMYKAGRVHDSEGYVWASELFALNFSDDISAETLFARHKEFGEKVEKMYPPIVARFDNDRDPERPLRIGYVSGDFNYHSVSFFLIPLLERHDRSAYEIYCYSLSDTADHVTKQIVERADVWRNVPFTPRAEVAELIHSDGIDILVDLSGHSGIPAFNVFARQPAPVQASWLGYLCTTGLTRIHYRISDSCSDPPGAADELHTETLVRLPHAQWCYRPFVPVEHAMEPPCLRNGFVTFGSFNQTAKLSRSVRGLWAETLRRVPRSRLVVLGIAPGPARDRVLREFVEDGVDPGRLTVEPRVVPEDYFRRIGNVDIALDSMPYSGGTTTCDALWMGVPVLTLPGSRSASRSAASILTTVGLGEWIASTPEDYVRRTVACAASTDTLGQLRRSLRGRMRASPLMDEPQFAHDMENAYRRMWRAWCRAAVLSPPP